MRIVWVLTVLRLVAGDNGLEANSMPTVPTQTSVPTAAQYEQLTIGLYETKSECRRMRDQVLNAPGFKAGSAQCHKELN
jgi:hypothetical protein